MKNFYYFGFILFVLMFQSTLFAKVIKLSSGSQQANLIELYTSEGCSSCPPADKWLNNLKKDPRLWKQVIPVAFHVDYWDYIGWKDTFAVPENTQRQAKYKQEGGIRTIYTPEIVNNGKEWRRWFGSSDIPVSGKRSGQLDVSIDAGKISAKFMSNDSNSQNLKLNVALLGFGFKTKIRAGENTGKSLAHDFVVIGQSSQKSTNGTWQMPLPISRHQTKKQGIAIWVSHTDAQEPIQVVGGWLN